MEEEKVKKPRRKRPGPIPLNKLAPHKRAEIKEAEKQKQLAKLPLVKCEALNHGYLDGYGLVTKGDIVEWPIDAKPRLWLKRLDIIGQIPDMTREELKNELYALGRKFYRGSTNEQLQAMLLTLKGQVVR